MTIRTAILGTGFMSWVHADALRRNGVEVYGILGSSLTKSETAAKQLGAAKAFASLDELLHDPNWTAPGSLRGVCVSCWAAGI